MNNDNLPNQLEQFMRMKAYYHGAAICYLLNNFKPDWKAEFELGKRPFDLLEETFEPVALKKDYVDNLLRIPKNTTNKEIKQKTFNKYQEWKNTLYISTNSETKVFFETGAKNLYSFENGQLIKNIKNLYYDNEKLNITGRSKSLFLDKLEGTEAKYNTFKIKNIPKKPKTCTKKSKTLWSCKAGTKIKISGLKIKIKKDMDIHFDEGIMQL